MTEKIEIDKVCWLARLRQARGLLLASSQSIAPAVLSNCLPQLAPTSSSLLAAWPITSLPLPHEGYSLWAFSHLAAPSCSCYWWMEERSLFSVHASAVHRRSCWRAMMMGQPPCLRHHLILTRGLRRVIHFPVRLTSRLFVRTTTDLERYQTLI